MSVIQNFSKFTNNSKFVNCKDVFRGDEIGFYSIKMLFYVHVGKQSSKAAIPVYYRRVLLYFFSGFFPRHVRSEGTHFLSEGLSIAAERNV